MQGGFEAILNMKGKRREEMEIMGVNKKTEKHRELKASE